MNTLLWVLQWLLAAVFMMAGAMKLLQPYQKMAADPRMSWVKDVSPGLVRTAGVTELLGAMALVLPGLIGVAELLTPLAGFGLAAQMLIAAVWIHRPRKENQMIAMNGMLLLLALVIGLGRIIEPLA